MARRVLARRKLLLVEQPIGQGKHSLVPARGLEDHTTLYDTTPFVELRAEFKLEDVFGPTFRPHMPYRLFIFVCLF